MKELAKRAIDVAEDVLNTFTLIMFGVVFIVSVIMYHDNKADIEAKAMNPLNNPIAAFERFSPVGLTENMLDVILWEER